MINKREAIELLVWLKNQDINVCDTADGRVFMSNSTTSKKYTEDELFDKYADHQLDRIGDIMLLTTYMKGFNDELNETPSNYHTDSLISRAYNLGRQDAIVGDDVSSIDLQGNEEILRRIKQ